MHISKEEVKKAFRTIFANYNAVKIELDYSQIDDILNNLVHMLGEPAYDSCLFIINTYIEQLLPSIQQESKAKFCAIWHYILEYCANNDIEDNSVLATLLGVYILEYSKKCKISLKDVKKYDKYFNSEDGPFLATKKWSASECDVTCIAYYVKQLYITAMETLKNPFAISSDPGYSLVVLERKNSIFMNLLLQDE